MRRPFAADYTWHINGAGDIHIVDRNLGNKSVTNDAEGVVEDMLAAVRAKFGPEASLVGRVITYTDSNGSIDRLCVDEQSRFSGFSPAPVRL